jgi:DNA replication and repair protein RecF
MPFRTVRFSSFRNLADAELDTSAERIFLVGENGQGKTNFLEALYYLSFGSSFRGSADGEAVRHGDPSFLLEASTSPSFESSLPPETIRIGYEGSAKEIRRSGKRVGDRKELVELNPAVVFCHEDFSIADGEPEKRRVFFDQVAGLVSGTYLDDLRSFKRVLRQRNAALKERQLSVIDLLDEQFVDKGLVLMRERASLREEISGLFSDIYEEVSHLGRKVELSFRPSWGHGSQDDPQGLVALLAERRNGELMMGTSLSGPHRDRWVFSCEGRNFAATASTGQLRLLSLVLRALQARYYTQKTARKPVLLLDDVLLELDPEKRKRFFATIPDSSQAFFTFLPGERWEDYHSSSVIVYRVDDGRFSR